MKSFVERKIDVQMALDGDTFEGSSNTVQLSGLRCQATITAVGGKTGRAFSNMQLRISGMRNADMAKLSTLGYDSAVFKKSAVNVYAGDLQSGMSLIFQGAVTYGNVDYNSMPDVGLEIVASEFAIQQYASIAANSYQGDVSVASMIEGIAQSMGKRCINNGVTAVLSNHAVAGGSIDQIADIARASNTYWKIKGDAVYIWPDGGAMDDTVIEVGPGNGMVGYPRYIAMGLKVTSLFNPNIEPGRWIKVTSSTPTPSNNNPVKASGIVAPGANGTFFCTSVTHNLASQQNGGSWFTEMELHTSNTVFRSQ